MSEFKSKTIFITGGTSGIGRATAIAFAKRGANVAITGRRVEEGKQTVELVNKAGGKGLFVRGDVVNEDEIKSAVDQTLSKFGKIDVAVNNAGVELFESLLDATPEKIRRVLDINVLGVVLSMKHEVAAMLKTGGGSIVNTGSVAGKVAFPTSAVYSASKHAVEGITKATALEFARQGIRINAVAPAAIQTDMADRAFGAGDSDGKKHVASLHPIGRIGTVEEVADAILWISSPGASFVTGQSIAIDGGYTAQ